MIKIIFMIFFLNLVACSKFEETLTLKKKPSGDEFLVEKKSPLVVPPDFGKLPMPIDQELDSQTNEFEDENEIEKLLITNENTVKKNEKSESSLEKLILEKIK